MFFMTAVMAVDYLLCDMLSMTYSIVCLSVSVHWRYNVIQSVRSGRARCSTHTYREIKWCVTRQLLYLYCRHHRR